MSRTYYEFLKAQDDYRIEHNLKVSSFPYPPKESIIYTRESTQSFWERRRTTTASQIPLSTLQFTVEDTFHFISTAAAYEEQKEREFLAKFFPQNEFKPTQSITDQFNILFQGRQRYERLLQRIKNAQARALWGWKGMAPNMDSLYASYLNTRLTKALENFRSSFTLTADLSQLEEKFKTLIDEAIIETTNDVAKVIGDDGVYGSGKDWEDIARILNEDEYLKSQFINNIRNAIGNDNFKTIFSAMIEQKQKGQKKQKTSTLVRKALKLNERTASIGGNVIENTMAALAQALGQIRGDNGSISYSVNGSAIGGQMVLTDAAMIFSASASIDTFEAMKLLNEQLSNSSGTLSNAYNAIENYYKQYNEQMDELYTVFVNSKNYQLGGNHGTYNQSYSGTLNELDDFLKRANVNVLNVENFLLAAYNTAEGAIYSSNKSEIYEGAIQALKAAAVNFMFDDWQTIGDNTSTSIHMFMLDGKYIPSSVVFRAMADAGNKTVTSKASINVPAINDPGAEYFNGRHDDITTKNEILEYWNKEFQRISQNARWTADFIINIKKAIDL